jgi:Cd2+/Zn2+-exporting ATPase
VLCLHFDSNIISLSLVEQIARSTGARVTNRYGHALLAIRAVDGEDATRRIEDALRSIPGVLHASVSLPAQRARVEFERGEISLEQVEQSLREMGYAPVKSSMAAVPHGAPKSDGSWYTRNKELVRSLMAGLLLLVGWLAERWLSLPFAITVGFYSASYVFGGFDLVRHSLGTWRRSQFTFDIDLLMLLAAIGAAVLGEWSEGAFLLFLFSLAHSLEHFALGRARSAIRALAELAPPLARVLRGSGETEIPVEQVMVGEIVIVRPAERIPIDGVIRSGRSAINQAPITGESVPVEKSPADEVFAGSINGDGALEITTVRTVGDRTLDRVVKLVEEAQTQKARTQQFTERFERIFVPTVLVLGALLIVVPPLLSLWSWQTSFYRAMALLVAASPCALALGTPATVLAGIAQAARMGVLIKGGAYLENLGGVRAMAFDKTGTLTIGKPEVTDIVVIDASDARELLRIAAAVEQRSQHPLAQAVVKRAKADHLDLPDTAELQSLTARGVRSSIAGEIVEIGSLRLWEENGTPVPEKVSHTVTNLQSNGRTTMAVRHGKRWLGVIGIADQPRPQVRLILGQLRQLNISPLVMLTGDNQGVGNAIGKEVGVDEVRANLLPSDKVDAVKQLLESHGNVAMVGDGVNDAPALAHATVGIAMGGAGTAVALETADVALMADDLGKLAFAISLARNAKSIIRQNLIISLCVIGILIVATTTGIFGIGPAVFIHEGSTIVVVFNALRLLAIK